MPTSDIQIQDPLHWNWLYYFKYLWTKKQVFWILFAHASSREKTDGI